MSSDPSTPRYPEIIACMNEQRQPMLAEIEIVAMRIWNDVRSRDGARWSDLHPDSPARDDMMHMALGALGVRFTGAEQDWVPVEEPEPSSAPTFITQRGFAARLAGGLSRFCGLGASQAAQTNCQQVVSPVQLLPSLETFWISSVIAVETLGIVCLCQSPAPVDHIAAAEEAGPRPSIDSPLTTTRQHV